MKGKRVELQYIKEFNSYGIPKSILEYLYKKKIIADIRPPEKTLKEDKVSLYLVFC